MWLRKRIFFLDVSPVCPSLYLFCLFVAPQLSVTLKMGASGFSVTLLSNQLYSITSHTSVVLNKLIIWKMSLGFVVLKLFIFWNFLYLLVQNTRDCKQLCGSQFFASTGNRWRKAESEVSAKSIWSRSLYPIDYTSPHLRIYCWWTRIRIPKLCVQVSFFMYLTVKKSRKPSEFEHATSS
jgi:hypothetical protein